jgi:hypothetical protein
MAQFYELFAGRSTIQAYGSPYFFISGVAVRGRKVIFLLEQIDTKSFTGDGKS